MIAKNMELVARMMSVVRKSRADYANTKNTHSAVITRNEDYFNQQFRNHATELEHLQANGFIRITPQHIYIIVA